MVKINFGSKLRSSQCGKSPSKPPLSHPTANPGPAHVHPWHVIPIEIRGGQRVAIAGSESRWNQAEVLLLVVLLSNKCIIWIGHQKAVQMNASTWRSVKTCVLQTVLHAILRAKGGARGMKSDLSRLFFVLWSQDSTHWKERATCNFSSRLIT